MRAVVSLIFRMSGENYCAGDATCIAGIFVFYKGQIAADAYVKGLVLSHRRLRTLGKENQT